MLTNCPECNLQVSDKAMVCPHCGYPLQTRQKYPENRKKPLKRRRLPNGFGQISEIKGRYLRKPFRAMVTVGVDETGHPICKLLKPEAYFETYNEAYAALVKYHTDPYKPESDITLKELYDLWSEQHFKGLGPDRIRNINSAWKYCAVICNVKVKDLKPARITSFLDGIENINTRKRVKSVINMMYDYAVNNEIVDRNYSRSVNIRSTNPETKHHISFSEDDLNIIWDNSDLYYASILLIQCYMGWRPQELGLIRTENVNINEGWIIGGMKTESGKDRKVPIHPAIIPIVKYHYSKGGEYLLTGINGDFLTYNAYRKGFNKLMHDLKIPDHNPHDGRKQFVTMCKKYNVDEYAIKRMVGHKIDDITEAVYTDRDIEWLKSEIEKIKV